ncbi:MAG: aldo/keto reductase [Acidimicrobiia bacterium]|jgi:aryl-alcohol dehydrogenase (NADP+)
MEKRHCGRPDFQLSVFGLGTMTFGAESDETTSHQILDRYFESGGRFIDTADVYSQGVSEEIIGRWLRQRRPDDIVIGTKARFAMGEGLENQGAGRDYLTRALDASLSRLGVDRVDLYQIHAWDPATPLGETLQTLNDFVQEGKVRHIGLSNYTGWQLERAVQMSSHHDWSPIVSMQPQYNLLAREIEWELMPVCLEHEVGLLPWSPLGGGWLTGKYSPDERPTGASRLGEDPGRGVEAYDLRNNERTWKVVAAVREIADKRDVSMSQVALNWVRNRPGVTSVLLGCRTVAQLDDNLAALSWNLDDDEMASLTEVSAPGMPTYPHGFLESLAGVDTWERMGTRAEPVL